MPASNANITGEHYHAVKLSASIELHQFL